MAQQINLYDPTLRRQRDWLSLSNVVAVAALLAVLLLAVGFVVNAQSASRQAALQALDTSLMAARAETSILSGKFGKGAGDDAQSRELADLKRQFAMRQEVLAALQGGAGVDSGPGSATVGFTDYLRGLARQTVSGLWLTGFSVGQGGSGIEVKGRMLVVDRLPEYIKRLNGESTFKGRQFVSLNIARSEKPASPTAAALGTPYAAFVLTAVPTVVSKDNKNKEAGK